MYKIQSRQNAHSKTEGTVCDNGSKVFLYRPYVYVPVGVVLAVSWGCVC